MKLLSLNVGKPQPYHYRGRVGTTSIFKMPVIGKRTVSIVNIEGDEQADLTVHGGALKAVYAYDISFYECWKKILQRDEWPYGMFGENLTTYGLADDTVCIGNIYQVGTVLLQAVQPRFPCYKLNIQFRIPDMLQQFSRQQMHGIYFSVIQQGTLEAGDEIKLVKASEHQVTMQQLVNSYYNKGADKVLLEKIISVDVLPKRLRQSYESFLV